MANFVELQDCQTTHNKLMEKIDKIVTTVSNIEVSIASLPKKIIDETDKKYASIETEKTVNRLAWIVITAVIMAILGLVLIK